MSRRFLKKCGAVIVSLAMALAMMFSLGACGGGGEPASSEVDFTKLTYAAFGDSITWGEDGETHEQMRLPYPNLVAEALELQNFYNYGKRGATVTFVTTNKVVMELVQEASSKADIVSVMIGVNDFAGAQKLGTIDDTGYDTIYGSLKNLADQLSQKYPKAFIFFMTPLKQYKSAEVNSQGYRLSDVAKAVKDVCAVKGLPVLDMYETCAYSLENDSKSDGLHPTQKFMATYATPQIVQFIQDNYSAK